MTYSKVSIFNMALNHLGITAPISSNSFDTDSRAIILNNFYETARDEVLKSFDWGFANTYKKLTLTVDTSPNPKYPFVYDCPNDCVSARAVIDSIKGEEKKFEIYSNSIGEKSLLADVENPILRYTKRVEKEVFFEPEFTIVLSYYLAGLAGETITGQQKKADGCIQKYEWKLNKAKQLNALEGTAEDEDTSQWWEER